MKERLYHLLNLKVSESGNVFELLRIQFFIGIAHSFTNIAAFTYFIYRFSIQGLPYAYLATAGTLLLLNVVYEQMEHKFSPLQLLKLIVLFSGIILLLFWSGLLMVHENTIIFLLLVWSVLFYMLTGYAYWGLVALLFNVRESKRVFSIVGAGDIPAKLIGYLAAPLLIPAIGLNNLLAFALLSLMTGLYFVQKLIKKETAGSFKVKHHAHKDHEPIEKSTFSFKNNFFLKHRLIFTISVLSILCYNVFNLIDYTFIAQVKERFKDISVLASFIAVFFGIGRIGALVLKLIFTSRVIERLGVIACLLITPTVLFIFSIVFLAFSDRTYYGLYFFGIMALFTEVLRSAIQEPAFFILFQPLNEQNRLKGHIIAKGYMLAPSLFIVGLSLILMRNMHIELSILFTIKILLVNLFLWAVIVYFIKKEYIKTLHVSIARGVFNGEDIHIYDQRTVDILLNKAHSDKEKENIYALRLLENGGYENMHVLLKEFLFSNKEEVKKYALTRLDERNELDTALLKELLPAQTNAEIKEKIISTLCKLDPLYLHALAEHLSKQEYRVRKTTIIHLLNQTEFEYLYLAGNEINNLIQSAITEERELAIEIISELKNIKFTNAIERLIEDSEPTVKRNALIAACKLRNKNLLPFVFNTLSNPANRYMVQQGLFQYGDELFDDLDIIPSLQIEAYKADLIKIAGKARGIHSTRFLLACLKQPHVTEKVIEALWIKGFEAEKAEDIYQFQNLLEEHLKKGTEKIDVYVAVAKNPNKELIRQSIYSEIKNDLTTALKTCAILYHKKEINRILELIENSDQKRIYNAMEMMELVLPKKNSKQINVLVDFILDPTAIKRKQITLDNKAFFTRVMHSGSQSFNQWTKAVCLYSSLQNNEIEFLRTVKAEANESLILSETKNYVLNTIQQTAYANH